MPGADGTQRDTHTEESAELKKFISRKKVIALALVVLLVGLAAYSLVVFAFEDSQAIYQGTKLTLDPNTFFYADVFTVMIFTDVLIVILSLSVSDRYELVFRNGAFVISTILIRFSLTTERRYSALLAVAGMVFQDSHAGDLQLSRARAGAQNKARAISLRWSSHVDELADPVNTGARGRSRNS